MTELELYKFLFDEDGAIGCEISWNGEELTCLLDFFNLDEFTEMIKDFLEDEAYETFLKKGYIGFDLVPICEFYEIEPENILKKR